MGFYCRDSFLIFIILNIEYTMSIDAFLQSLFKTEMAKPMELASELEVGTTRIGRDRLLYRVVRRKGQKVWKRLNMN